MGRMALVDKRARSWILERLAGRTLQAVYLMLLNGLSPLAGRSSMLVCVLLFRALRRREKRYSAIGHLKQRQRCFQDEG